MSNPLPPGTKLASQNVCCVVYFCHSEILEVGCMENIGNYIRARRREINMSQVELGEKIGKSSQLDITWERGYTKGGQR